MNTKITWLAVIVAIASITFSVEMFRVNRRLIANCEIANATSDNAIKVATKATALLKEVRITLDQELESTKPTSSVSIMSNGYMVQYSANGDTAKIILREPLKEKNAGYVAGISDPQMPDLAKKLLEVRGVQATVLQPYEILVQRAQSYSWEEIVNSATAVVKEHQPKT